MRVYKKRFFAFCCLAVACSPVRAADPGIGDARALAARIDAYMARRWAEEKVEPAAPATDAEFLRRVYLDLIGRIPTVSEARTFLDDSTADKRSRLVDQLLRSPGFASHFANVYRALLLPEADTTLVGRFLTPGMEAWLREQLAAEVPYDQLTRTLLTIALDEKALQDLFQFGGGTPSPVGFYIAKEVRPENLAGATARAFLGIRLECAQCHDHPFAKWKRDQFWELAAFFAGIERQDQGEVSTPRGERMERREVAVGSTGRVVQAALLDGAEPRWRYKTSPRVALADWITAPDNPYFARAAVNRLWAHFFGLGLTEPVDDMEGNEALARHPELLQELAREFAAHKFDLKFLIRALTATRSYQLTSRNPALSTVDPQLFSRKALKGLTPEQLFDSLVKATGYREPTRKKNPFEDLYDNESPRAAFLRKFANRTDRPTEAQTSILQALSLMNNKFMVDATTLGRSELLTALAESPFHDTAGRIETLFLATLSRRPTERELARFVELVDTDEAGPRTALTDVFWVLLNTSEFSLNH